MLVCSVWSYPDSHTAAQTVPGTDVLQDLGNVPYTIFGRSPQRLEPADACTAELNNTASTSSMVSTCCMTACQAEVTSVGSAKQHNVKCLVHPICTLATHVQRGACVCSNPVQKLCVAAVCWFQAFFASCRPEPSVSPSKTCLDS
jgi:hypothetical protein